MTEGLVLEFEGVGREAYDAVNAQLGVNPYDGTGDWPPGLLHHSAGETESGLMVVEVWESREAQAAFMEARLGRALQEGGITAPPARMTWASIVAMQNLPG